MSSETQRVLAAIQQVTEVVEILQDLPELWPLAQKMLAPIMAATPSVPGKPQRIGSRRMTAARRKRLSVLAKKRWAKAKKAGKNTIGAAD